MRALKNQTADAGIRNDVENYYGPDGFYVDVIVKRYQQFTGQQAVHAESGKTFDEMAEVAEAAA